MPGRRGPNRCTLTTPSGPATMSPADTAAIVRHLLGSQVPVCGTMPQAGRLGDTLGALPRRIDDDRGGDEDGGFRVGTDARDDARAAAAVRRAGVHPDRGLL